MLFQNKGIRDAVRKDHADKLRKIIEDSGVSTKGVSDSELIKVVKQLTNESVNEGKKRFKQQDGVGSSKYTISYHDGKKKHKDGSDFFDIKIFKNKPELEAFKKDLVSKGFVSESVVNEAAKPTIKIVTKLKNEQGIQIVVVKTTDGDTEYGGFVVRGKLQKIIPVGANKTKNDVQKRALQIWDEFGKQLGENKIVNEGKYDADLDKVEAAATAASSFMGVGAELKKAGIKYTFVTEMIPMYMIPVPGNTIAICNKKYAAGAEREVKDMAIGLLK